MAGPLADPDLRVAGMRYLLDTNILSEPTRKIPDARVLEHLRAHRDEVVSAAPVIHELRHGIARLPLGRRRDALSDYLDRLLRQPIRVLPYDRTAALWHAERRAALEAQGYPTPYADGQIAAIAATQGLVLVTRNVADFARFTDLAVESWFGG